MSLISKKFRNTGLKRPTWTFKKGNVNNLACLDRQIKYLFYPHATYQHLNRTYHIGTYYLQINSCKITFNTINKQKRSQLEVACLGMLWFLWYYKPRGERCGMVVSTSAFGAGGPRFKSRQGQRLYLFTYLIIYLVSFKQFSFLYRLIMITNNEITCGRGACTCTKDDAEE